MISLLQDGETVTAQKRANEKLRLKITHLKPEERKGLVVVITGHGKGKTSSALGMIVRACGH